jgi:hypothetical protein
MRMWPKAGTRGLSLPAKHPTASSLMAAVAAGWGATAATEVTAENPAQTENPAVAVSLRLNR